MGASMNTASILGAPGKHTEGAGTARPCILPSKLNVWGRAVPTPSSACRRRYVQFQNVQTPGLALSGLGSLRIPASSSLLKKIFS
jgi:hypothetical protein